MAARVAVTARCLRDSVDRLIPYLVATTIYEKSSPGSRDSILSIAAWIGSILIELSRVED